MAAALQLRSPRRQPGAPAWTDTYLGRLPGGRRVPRPMSRLRGFEDGRMVCADSLELLAVAADVGLLNASTATSAWQELVVWDSAVLAHRDGRRLQLVVGVHADERTAARWTAHLLQIACDATPSDHCRTFKLLDDLLIYTSTLLSAHWYKDDDWVMRAGWELHPTALDASRGLARLLDGQQPRRTVADVAQALPDA